MGDPQGDLRPGTPILVGFFTEISKKWVLDSKTPLVEPPNPPPVRATVGEVRYSIEIDVGGGGRVNFTKPDFEENFSRKWAPRIRNRAHISQNLSGQKIVQFSRLTPPLHGRSPKMQIRTLFNLFS